LIVVVSTVSPKAIVVEAPKSANFTTPASSTKIFPPLMSL
jgi:hypothetical protein